MNSARQHLKRERREARNRSSDNNNARACSPILFEGARGIDEPVMKALQREAQRAIATVDRKGSPETIMLPRIDNNFSAIGSSIPRVSPIETGGHVSAFQNNVKTTRSARSTSDTASAPRTRMTGKFWVRRRARQILRRNRKKEMRK